MRNLITVLSDGLYYTEILTDQVQHKIEKAGIQAGFVNLLVQHTTSAVLLVEHEAGIIMDIKEALKKLLPESGKFYHHQRGVDHNGAGHVLSALFNGTLTIPIIDGEMVLGTYQEIMFMDFQPERTERTVAVTIIGASEP
ncbi:MAG: secondary thiamine-phosphate synthase enzyme YjbQ [Alkalispirochaeta sp.]